MSAVFRTYAELGRLRISLFTCLSAMAGYLLSAFSPGPGMLGTGIGVFLLSSGASALNQYQEQGTDSMMERTKGRPLPSGRITVRKALIFSALTASVGLLFIFLSGGGAGLAGGLCAVVWYNGLYTHLKKMTVYAAVPGALVGSIPPALGWIAGGGSWADPVLFLFCLFFYLWQVPHFWLIALKHREEYRYSGLPVVTTLFSVAQLSRIVFVWTMSAAVFSILFVPYGLALHRWINYLIVMAAFGTMLRGAGILGRAEERFGRSLKIVNLHLLAVMTLLITDRLMQ